MRIEEGGGSWGKSYEISIKGDLQNSQKYLTLLMDAQNGICNSCIIDDSR